MPRRSHASAARSRDPSVSLAHELWQYLNRLVQRFEDVWRCGQPASIDDYLREIDGERHGLLVELVHQDLACRIEAGQAARTEGYLQRYPQLRSDPAVLLDLLADECQSVMLSFFVRARLGQQARRHSADRRDFRRAEGLGGAEPGTAGGGSPSQVVAAEELLRELRARLSEEEGRIAELRRAGHSWAEVAAELGGSADSRRVQFHRAIAR
jgi:hypothetical protein